MNLAEAAQLILTLSLRDEVSSGLKGIQSQLDRTGGKSATLSGGLSKVGQGLGVGLRNTARLGGLGLAALWTQVNAGIDSLVELEDVTNQTKAVIKSTGGVAGLTAEDIRDLAKEYEELSGVDDKVIEGAEDVLLTFTNVRKDAFEPALLAALDLSEAMEQDLQSSIVQIGKALNDPIKGMTALQRVGVTFTEEQKKVIEAMVKTGDVAGAQQLILEELNREFGGSAQASMEGYRGTQLRLKDTWEELQMTLAEALLPALDNLSRMLKDRLSDPAVKDGVKKLGEAIAGLFSKENVAGGGEAIKGLFNFLKELPWGQIKDGLSFAAENAKKVVDVFRSLPPGVQAGLLTFLAANKLTGGLVASGLGELAKVALSSLRTITAANVTVVGANVTNGAGGLPGVPGGAGGAGAAAAIGTVGTAVGVGLVGAGLIVTAVAEAGNAIQRAQGRSEEQIRLQNQITQWTADRELAAKHGATQATIDAYNRRINEARAQFNGITATAQRQLLVNSEVRDRLTTTNTNLGTLTQIGADHRATLREVYVQAQEQKRLALIGNFAASEANTRLSAIQVSSQRTAQKDFSMSVTVHTNLNVSGERIAANIQRIERIGGFTDY